MFEPPVRIIDKEKIRNLTHSQCRVLLALFDDPYASTYMLSQTLATTWHSVRNHLSNIYAVLGINMFHSSRIAILLEIERSEIRDQFLETAPRKKRTYLAAITK